MCGSRADEQLQLCLFPPADLLRHNGLWKELWKTCSFSTSTSFSLFNLWGRRGGEKKGEDAYTHTHTHTWLPSVHVFYVASACRRRLLTPLSPPPVFALLLELYKQHIHTRILTRRSTLTFHLTAFEILIRDSKNSKKVPNLLFITSSCLRMKWDARDEDVLGHAIPSGRRARLLHLLSLCVFM